MCTKSIKRKKIREGGRERKSAPIFSTFAHVQSSQESYFQFKTMKKRRGKCIPYTGHISGLLLVDSSLYRATASNAASAL